MKTCCIALGGNLGSPETAFQSGLDDLADHGVRLKALSSFYESRPMGENAGGQFTNAVALVDFDGNPHDLLLKLHQAETLAGRTRDVFWGPRTLDLDLIFAHDQTVQTDQLTLPHPSMWYRWFVLKPLCELLPDWKHPTLLQTASQLLQAIERRPVSFSISNGTKQDHAVLMDWQAEQSADVQLVFDQPQQLPTAQICLQPGNRPVQPPLEFSRTIQVYVADGLGSQMDAIRDAVVQQKDTRTMSQ